MKEFIEKISDYKWKIDKKYNPAMKVDGIIYADDKIMKSLENEGAVEQVANVACLPGIALNSLAMPDIHWGYGFPIGGVAAFRKSDGVITPGGIGYDINCGVRLLRTNLKFEDVKEKIKQLTDNIFINIPSGVGKKGLIKLNKKDLHNVLKKGALWSVENGFGEAADIEFTESSGVMDEAEPSNVSQNSLNRGADQLGTLGSGNHFIEIQVVSDIYDEITAREFGIYKGQLTILIHTGSRGLGHQVCTDYLSLFNRAVIKYAIEIPDRQLACAPINSSEGNDYFSAMASAANFAWANRQVISHYLREAFEKVFKTSYSELGMSLVYDVSHNIAKFETHMISNKKEILCVHRKGATRAFPIGHIELPDRYKNTGQPVLVPGDMGRCSYLMVGAENSLQETFGSSCHGAGRQMSRSQAKKKINGRELEKELNDKGIYIRTESYSGLSEEAPEAYKNVIDIVQVCHNANISRKVAKMKPLGVIKG